jgi:2-amino-4-hydroxy-6-hydroxymethyldihydropteridine diphosphokinase
MALSQGGMVNNGPANVYLGLGANLGDREKNLRMALDLVSHRLRLIKQSSLYDTAPIGDTTQPRFLNMACQVSTMLPPPALLTLVQGFESMLGRAPRSSGAPRPLDIDILLYGDLHFTSPDLIIPHPKMAEREFVLAPLAEIAPEVIHPVLKKTIKELLAPLARTQDVVKMGKLE